MMRPALRRWSFACAATVLSTYALDAVATAAGLALVASGLLLGLDHVPILAFLAASYVAWGAGLGVNLAANWPGVLWLICSLEDWDEPVVRAFRIDDEEIEEEDLDVV